MPTGPEHEGRTENGTAARLDDVVSAIRTVEHNLDRRARDARSINAMIWGITGALIFVFYQLVTWNPLLYLAVFGPFLPWAWTVPLVIGYALTTIVSLHAGRRTRDDTFYRDARWSLVSFVIIVPLIAAFVVFAQPHRIPGLLLIWLAVETISGCGGPAGVRGSPATAGLVVSSFLAGVALLVYPVAWAWIVAAAFFGLGLTGLGIMVRRSA